MAFAAAAFGDEGSTATPATTGAPEFFGATGKPIATGTPDAFGATTAPATGRGTCMKIKSLGDAKL